MQQHAHPATAIIAPPCACEQLISSTPTTTHLSTVTVLVPNVNGILKNKVKKQKLNDPMD
jgi:hypothetical protein